MVYVCAERLIPPYTGPHINHAGRRIVLTYCPICMPVLRFVDVCSHNNETEMATLEAETGNGTVWVSFKFDREFWIQQCLSLNARRLEQAHLPKEVPSTSYETQYLTQALESRACTYDAKDLEINLRKAFAMCKPAFSVPLRTGDTAQQMLSDIK